MHWLSILFLLWPFPAFAEDIQQTVLLLPDAAAECRYYRACLDNVVKEISSLATSLTKAEQSLAQQQPDAAKAMLDYVEKRDSEISRNEQKRCKDIITAIAVKRGTLPDCIIQTERALVDKEEEQMRRLRIYERMSDLDKQLKSTTASPQK